MPLKILKTLLIRLKVISSLLMHFCLFKLTYIGYPPQQQQAYPNPQQVTKKETNKIQNKSEENQCIAFLSFFLFSQSNYNATNQQQQQKPYSPQGSFLYFFSAFSINSLASLLVGFFLVYLFF